MRILKTTFCLAACALSAFIAGATLTARTLGQASPAKSAPPKPARAPDMMQTRGRIVITAPSKPFYLGEESTLELKLKGPAPLHILTMQSVLQANGVSSPSIEGGDKEAVLNGNGDGHASVKFTPLRAGKLEVRVNVFFSDGGFDGASVIVDVVTSSPPVKLAGEFVMKGVNYILMDLSEEDRSRRLRISATYAGVNEPLPIQPDQAQFKLAMSKEAPPIDFDPSTLKIKALRIGHALIETRYGGLSLRTCVLVRESRDGYDPSDCSELSADADKPAAALSAIRRPFESQLPYRSDDNRTGRFLADDRVDAVTPSQPLYIAQDNPITIRVHGPAVARIDCHPLRRELPCYPWTGDWQWKGGGSPTAIPLVENSAGSVAVNVFPMEFGRNEFTFSIFFVDGGVALKKITAEVDAGSVRPTSIGEWCDRETPDRNLPIELVPPKDGREDFRGKRTLTPGVCYNGVRGAASPPATSVRYQVRSEGKESPIELDPATGAVKAVRPGQALVQESFAGLTADTCVVVAPLEEPNASNCRQLRAKYGTPLPPLKYPVRPPQIADSPERPQPGRVGGIVVLAGKSQPIPSVDAIAGARLSPDVRDRFNADARLTFLTEGLVAELGQPTKLPVRLDGPPVLSVGIGQELVQYYNTPGPVPYEESAFEEGKNADRIGRSADGSPFLHVVPLRPGTAEFHISILFADAASRPGWSGCP